MDGRSRYNKMINILKPWIGETKHISQIRRMIAIDIGISEGVIQSSLRFMINTGLITETDHLIFRVNNTQL